MLPYWLMFTLWAGIAVLTERRQSRSSQHLFFIAAAVVTMLMIGLRFEVGGDWGAYERMYEVIYFLGLPEALSVTDPGYAAVNWLAAQIGFGIPMVNTVCAMLFIGGFARLAWRQPNPALAMLVAVPYLIIVVAMGYTRQAAAIGLVCLAIADTSERRLLRTVILIGIAALFHKSAILTLPIVLVPIFRRNIIFGVFGAILFLALFALLVSDSSDRLITNYVQGSYDSQGAAIRVAMNVVAAGLFLLLRKRIDMPEFQKSFWTTSSLLALASVAALVVASASSGVDRISLYLIPLQIVLYSRLPYALSRDGRALPSVLIAVLGYSFLVQYVWLNYAENSGYWIPYSIYFASEQ